MDIKDIKLLVKMVTQTDITEFELESGEEKLVIRRGAVAGAPAPMVTNQVASAPPAAAPATAPVVAAAAEPEPKPADDGFEEVHSPIVGTFYRAASPETESYVEIGSIVEKGETLCIVEAMKLMNEIEAEYKCKVVKILKENAEAVEYGEPLFLVEPL